MIAPALPPPQSPLLVLPPSSLLLPFKQLLPSHRQPHSARPYSAARHVPVALSKASTRWAISGAVDTCAWDMGCRQCSPGRVWWRAFS